VSGPLATSTPLADSGGRIVCVGTTSLRLMEAAAAKLGASTRLGAIRAFFITPGYRFARTNAGDEFPSAALDLFML